MRQLIAILSFCAIAACSREQQQPTAPASESPAPAETAAATPIADTIPQALRGRWGMVPADCTSTRGDNKGLMTIGARDIRFYESVATLGAVKQADATTLRATFAYEGEGMAWQREAELIGKPDGKTLTLEEFGTDAVPGARSYQRCE